MAAHGGCPLEAICLIVDIDGFWGRDPATNRQVIVPREIAISRCDLAAGGGGSVHKVDTLYYHGGLSFQFRKRNGATHNYQSKNVHGFPRYDQKLIESIPADAMLLKLAENPTSAAEEGKKTAGYRLSAIVDEIDPTTMLFLMHKGGGEGQWLRPLGRAISKTRSGGVSVVDLEDIGCPKAGTLLENGLVVKTTCNSDVHGLVKDKTKWAHHCPQSECAAYAHWVLTSCCVVDSKLSRVDTLDMRAVAKAIADNAHKLRPPAPEIWTSAVTDSCNFGRCQRYIRELLRQKCLHATGAVIDVTIQHIAALLSSQPGPPER